MNSEAARMIALYGPLTIQAYSAVASRRPDSNSSEWSGLPNLDPIVSHGPLARMPWRDAKSRAMIPIGSIYRMTVET